MLARIIHKKRQECDALFEMTEVMPFYCINTKKPTASHVQPIHEFGMLVMFFVITVLPTKYTKQTKWIKIVVVDSFRLFCVFSGLNKHYSSFLSQLDFFLNSFWIAVIIRNWSQETISIIFAVSFVLELCDPLRLLNVENGEYRWTPSPYHAR